MDNERFSKVKIGDQEYKLVLTTRATKEIAKRYGGLGKLGENLLKEKDFDKTISEVIWLVTLLANQGILIENLTKDAKSPCLTEDEVEILTIPGDIALFKDAISEALIKGTKRNIESEDTQSKNVQVG